MRKICEIINKYSKTFEDIAYEWLEIKKYNTKKSSYSTYSYSVRKFLMPEFQSMTLKKLENYNYKQFIDELCQDLEPKTVRDIVNNLKSILFLVQKDYNCKINIKDIKLPKMNSKILEILSDKEKMRLEDYCLKENNMIYFI